MQSARIRLRQWLQRRVLLFGLILIAIALYLVRAVDLSPQHLFKFGSVVTTFSLPADSWQFSGMPATFYPALLLLSFGALLIAAGTSSHSRPEILPSLTSNLGVGLLYLAAAVAVIVLLASWEYYRLLRHSWSLAAYLTVLGFGVLAVRRHDRQTGTPPLLPLSAKEATLLFFGMCATVLIFARDLNSWKFSFIGDEYSFYDKARILAEEGLSSIPWLEATGVYNTMPLAISGFQAIFLYLFGANNYSWRFSMVCLSVLSLPAVYVSAKALMSEQTSRRAITAAIAATGFFAFNELVLAWAKIGKPHAGFVTPLAFSVGAYLVSRSNGSRTMLLVAGIFAGCGWMLSSLGPLVSIAVLAGMWALDSCRSILLRPERAACDDAFARGCIIFSGFIAGISPMLVQLDYLEALWNLMISSEEAARNRPLFWPKLVQSLSLPLYYRAPHHFLWRNVIDPGMAFFIIAFLGCFHYLGWTKWCLLVWCFFVSALVCGAMSQYAYPPPTRVMVLAFPLSLMGGTAFAAVAGGRRFSPALALLAVTASACFSVTKLEQINPFKRPAEYAMIELKIVEESVPTKQHVLLFPDRVHAAWLMRLLSKLYAWENLHVMDDVEGSPELIIDRLCARFDSVEVRTAYDPVLEAKAQKWCDTRCCTIGPNVATRLLPEPEGTQGLLTKILRQHFSGIGE